MPYSIDLSLLRKYWVQRPLAYHHTAPVLHIYALHEALREVAVEGLEARWARHMDAGRFLQDEVRSRGLELLAEPEHQLPQLTAVRGARRRRRQDRSPAACCSEHGIEIGGGLAGAPPMWRIGLMGVNADRAVASRVLDALDAVLADGACVRRQRVEPAGCRRGTQANLVISPANLRSGDGFAGELPVVHAFPDNPEVRRTGLSAFTGRRTHAATHPFPSQAVNADTPSPAVAAGRGDSGHRGRGVSGPRGLERVAQQHGDRHRAHATRHRGDQPRHLDRRGELDVAHQA